jgi:hypothetical protein
MVQDDIESLSPDSLQIVSWNAEDGSIVIDASAIDYLYENSVSFYVHIRLEGSDWREFAAFQVNIDLSDYVKSLDPGLAIYDRQYKYFFNIQVLNETAPCAPYLADDYKLKTIPFTYNSKDFTEV